MRAVAAKTLALLAVGLCLSAFAASPALAAPASGAKTDQVQSAEIGRLEEDLARNEKWFDRVLLPITILLAILGLGGGLGVVFSIRDQRRISQLHQLTVTGELSAQHRAEQGYATFLEQSQTTLSLVNDTLKLGKEATDRAAHSMQQRAQSQVNAIEERARELMIEAFSDGEFESIVADAEQRAELHSIADSLRLLEGYLSLQDMELPQYARFVKAVDQFLHDETEAALRSLQLASQERAVGNLGQFVEYWLGYVLTTVGAYREALTNFGHDEIDVIPRSSQYFQLKRVIAETEFFARAAASAKDAERKDQKAGEHPRARLERVIDLLDGLAAHAVEMEEPSGEQAKTEDRLAVARTRADILEWVAYDPRHLDEPINDTKRMRAAGIEGISEPVVSVAESELWKKLEDPDIFRYWALCQAKEVCQGQPDPNIDLRFALAESRFKLGLEPEITATPTKTTTTAYKSIVHDLPRKLGPNLEKRRIASLHQSLLIAHVRLHKLDPAESGKHVSDARRAHRDAREALNDIAPRVTIFSQIQRRNLSGGDFKKEIDAIIDQEGIKPEGG